MVRLWIVGAYLNVLPYRLLLLLGRSLGTLGARYGQKTRRSRHSQFRARLPDKPADEVAAMVSENFKNTGMALIETGITWFWLRGALSES